ncbi:MAG TPA: hypothetical protein VER96_13600 [Polyangiaceae bacterium]|nr:hypothetical protein [Polyangiaceae bacterium]
MSHGNADPRATDRRNGTTVEALDPRIVRFLGRLCAEAFFGKVVVSFQHGKIVDVRTEQTRKLDEL